MSATTEISASDRLLTLKQVREIVPKDKATIYRWIAKGNFPAGYQIGPQSVAWLQSEIMAWMAKRTQRPPH